MTDTQTKVLLFVSKYWGLYHCAPTLTDICKGVNLTKTPIGKAIRQLKDLGYIFIGINRRPTPIWVINAIDNSVQNPYSLSLLTEYTEEQKDNTKIDGYVYVILAGETELYKIGRTNNLSRRMKAIKEECGKSIALLFSFETNDMIELERRLHKRFRNAWQHGEWFALKQKSIDYVRMLHNTTHGVIVL